MNQTDENTINALLKAAETPVPEAETAAPEPETAAPEAEESLPAEAVKDETAAAEQAPAAAKAKQKKERSIEELMEEEAKENEDKPASAFSLNRTLGGVIIARAIQKQIWLVLLITVFLIIYINNRYMCQKQVVQIDKLEKKLTEARYKATVCTSVLTEKSRQSNIIKMLEDRGDSTLTIPKEPPFSIRVNQ